MSKTRPYPLMTALCFLVSLIVWPFALIHSLEGGPDLPIHLLALVLSSWGIITLGYLNMKRPPDPEEEDPQDE